MSGLGGVWRRRTYSKAQGYAGVTINETTPEIMLALRDGFLTP